MLTVVTRWFYGGFPQDTGQARWAARIIKYRNERKVALEEEKRFVEQERECERNRACEAGVETGDFWVAWVSCEVEDEDRRGAGSTKQSCEAGALDVAD